MEKKQGPENEPAAKRTVRRFLAGQGRKLLGGWFAGAAWLGVVGLFVFGFFALASILEQLGFLPPGYHAVATAKATRGIRPVSPDLLAAYFQFLAEIYLGAALGLLLLTTYVALCWWNVLRAPGWLRRLRESRERSLGSGEPMDGPEGHEAVRDAGTGVVGEDVRP